MYANMVDLQESIREKIVQARTNANMTQHDLARALGVSDKTTIYRYEKGLRQITIGALEGIAKATGKPIIWFFSNDADQIKPEYGSLSEAETFLLETYRNVNEDGKRHLLECAYMVSESKRFKKHIERALA